MHGPIEAFVAARVKEPLSRVDRFGCMRHSAAPRGSENHDASTWAFADPGTGRRRLTARAVTAALLLSAALVIPGRVQAIIQKVKATAVGSSMATTQLVTAKTKPTSVKCTIRKARKKKTNRH